MEGNSFYEMTAEEVIMSRASALKLDGPAPTPEHLEQILAAADRAPDHGRIRPWRVVVAQGSGIATFGNLLADSLKRRRADASEGDLERERAKAARAPMILVVSAAVDRQSKVPEVEQVLAVAAAVQNMFLMAHSLGYGAMWKTGDPAYDAGFKRDLKIAGDDPIVAFLYLGTPIEMGAVRSPVVDFARSI